MISPTAEAGKSAFAIGTPLTREFLRATEYNRCFIGWIEPKCPATADKEPVRPRQVTGRRQVQGGHQHRWQSIPDTMHDSTTEGAIHDEQDRRPIGDGEDGTIALYPFPKPGSQKMSQDEWHQKL